MPSVRVYGPYKARSGYRMVVVDGPARKSMVVPTIEAAEKLRADLQQTLIARGAHRISEALAEYQDYLLRVRGAVTAGNIARAIERFLGDYTSLAAISEARAAALYEAETRRLLDGKGRPVAAASHRTLLGQCKRFYAWAVERGYTPQNPFATIKPVGKPKVGKAQLRIDEARRFVALALQRAQAGDRAATGALMALMLGMRAGEVLGRIVRDLDDGGRVLWITRGKTDNARRRLQVPEVLRPLLLRCAEGKTPEAFLFGNSPLHPGKPLSDAWLWTRIQKLCQEAGVPRVSTHSLRGLHSTLALEAGATSSAVAAALGHGSFQITAKHYAAPGTVERVRSRAVAETLGQGASAEDDLATTDPAVLLQALQHLPADMRAELRKALRERSKP
ncbi:MAG TPA: site-specific integrase [Pseudomonadota bacterium]|nr:site-specific integrase [Pseudomonadota bacterium]